MCGIAGYVGFRSAREVILKSLKRLEYRGYDSAGVAIMNHGINVAKKKGYIDSLKVDFDGNVGIGHTRWATHGIPSDKNAHPFVDCKNEFAIVHNGIIENYMELKEELIKKGHKFTSDTDSEVVVHLIEDFYKDSFKDAFMKAISKLKGSFAIVAIHKGEKRIMGVKKDSPLVVGLGDHENFVASDIPAFLEYTNRIVVLKDGDVCEITDDFVKFYDMNGKEIRREMFYVEWSIENAEKGGYEHFMLKEIFEQPSSIENTLYSLLSRNVLWNYDFDRITIVACGTSYHAGLVGKYIIEELTHVPVDVYYASEYRYRARVMDQSFTILITQSGETADTLAAAKIAVARGNSTLAITNVLGSSITNYVHMTLYTNAGPEIGVAATKTFISQLTSLYYFAIKSAYLRGDIEKMGYESLMDELKRMPYVVENTLLLENIIKVEVNKLKDVQNMFYIARNVNYPIALEGALKMKEISYIHAEGYPAGELKHGPLALLKKGFPVVVLISKDRTYEKMLSNIKEVSARGSYVIGVSSESEVGKYVDSLIKIPDTNPLFSPFPNVVALQLLAYHTARLLGREIDKPRNLAKSVTVE